jgi:hypothetical protein
MLDQAGVRPERQCFIYKNGTSSISTTLNGLDTTSTIIYVNFIGVKTMVSRLQVFLISL